jgi:Acetyltransferase (GNAT) domain
MNFESLANNIGTSIHNHQRIRKATGFQFAFADDIELLSPLLWDELTASKGLLMSRGYLRALAAANIPHFQQRFALVFRNSKPIAAVSMQLVEVGVDRLHALRTWPPEALQLEQRVKQRVLICGNLLSYELDGVAFAQGLDAETRWRAVTEVLYRVRRAEKLSGEANFVLVKDLNSEQKTDSALMHQLSYRSIETEPNMVLTLRPEWRSYTDYLGALTSKHRSSIKKSIFEPIEKAACRVVQLSAEQVEQHAARLQQLYLAVQNRAALRPLTVNERYWCEMAKLGPGRAIVKALMENDEIAGFVLITASHGSVTAAQIGFDREIARRLPLYLRLLHASVETAFEEGAKQVIFGRTALEPKARLGCKAVPTHLWARHRIPVVNALVRGLFAKIQHAKAPAIEPFKHLG